MLQNTSVNYTKLINIYNKVIFSATHIFSDLKEITGLLITDTSLKALGFFSGGHILIHFWTK